MITRFTASAALIAISALAYQAQAQDRPACPSGNEHGLNWVYDEDHVWLTSPDTDVVWTLADGTSATTKGVTFSLYWSSWYDFYEGKQMKDGDKKLQLGFFVPPPNHRTQSVNAFATGEPMVQHDYFVQLNADGELVSDFEQNFDKGWKSTVSSNVFVSASDNVAAPELLGKLEAGPTDIKIDVRVKGEYDRVANGFEFGSASFTLPSIGNLGKELKPKAEAEMARAKSSRVYCIEPQF